MIFINSLLSLLFLFMKHPLSMGLILLAQTIFVSLYLGMYFLNYWFSYIILLIMVGGMLILFIYMTSIASNEKFKFNTKLLLFSLSLSSIILFLSMKSDYFLLTLKYFNFSLFDYFNKTLPMSKFYNFPKNMIMNMIIIYLLICLIAIVKICKTNQGPLRHMF